MARSDHAISRKQIDPDALKVLYRLHQNEYVAYLVGGSVRDLLLGRRPKDFDIGTSAHPYQVKRLFRNCWIIGRRFRLAHVRFGPKNIEVATFRRQVTAQELAAAEELTPIPLGEVPSEAEAADDAQDRLLHRDNTFGTPEEDAFRRDFTINALFYDIGTFSIIDYTGGLQDLDARLIRSIGDPEIRFLEDPVRMLRAVVLAARLEFAIDEESLEAIFAHKHEIARSAAPRLLEEYYKILRSGHAAEAFRQLDETGLLREITPELEDAPEAFWTAMGAIDRYRAQFNSAPDSLTNTILAGTLLHPMGIIGPRTRFHADALERKLELGLLPIPRRDVERLQQIFSMVPRVLDIQAPMRAQRGLLHRQSLNETLTWLEIHGERPDVVAHWRELQAQRSEHPAANGHDTEVPLAPFKRRRRRRRPPRRSSV